MKVIGFSLVEVMVILAILGIIAAIAIPTISDNSGVNTVRDRDGSRSLPDQQARDRRTCTLNGMNFKLNSKNEVACIPKDEETSKSVEFDFSSCTTLIVNGGQKVCIK